TCFAMIEATSVLASAPTAPRALPSIRVVRKGAIALGIKFTGAGLALAVQVSLARTLGHAGYGEFAYAFAWLQLMLIFAHGGFATAALRFVGEYRACGQAALTRGFITRSSQIALAEAGVLTVIMVGGAIAFHGSGATDRMWNFL